MGYVPLAVRQLGAQGFKVTLRDLGLPTAVIGRDFQDLGRQNGRAIEANFIEAEMPFVLPDSTVVTIFAGINEVNGIRSRADAARVVVLNVPNAAGLPFLAGASLAQRQAAQRVAVRMTTTVVNQLVSRGVVVVDAMCDARSYLRSNYSQDGLHPNDAGYAFIAAEVVRAMTAAAYPGPQGSCAPMTLVP